MSDIKHQLIFKQELDEVLKKGPENSIFIIFTELETGFFVQYSFDEKGFLLDCPDGRCFDLSVYGEKELGELIELLKSFNFKNGNNNRELNEKEFFTYREKICAQCGKDINFIAYLTDIIFREILKFDDDYHISVEVGK